MNGIKIVVKGYDLGYQDGLRAGDVVARVSTYHPDDGIVGDYRKGFLEGVRECLQIGLVEGEAINQ